jgi:hypothetical protein
MSAHPGLIGLVHRFRGLPVMLDSDLSSLYGVSTKQLNQQVRRNLESFPADFMFRLTRAEMESLRSQFVTSNVGRGGRRTLPLAFTQEGVAMLSSVLKSRRARQANRPDAAARGVPWRLGSKTRCS